MTRRYRVNFGFGRQPRFVLAGSPLAAWITAWLTRRQEEVTRWR